MANWKGELIKLIFFIWRCLGVCVIEYEIKERQKRDRREVFVIDREVLYGVFKESRKDI